MFDQKGLFQTDISVHHALFTAALRNYHSASQLATMGNMDSQTQHSDSDSAAQLWHSDMPGNEWGFQHMTDRVEAAQRAEAAVTAAGSGFATSLPDLQVCCCMTKPVSVTPVDVHCEQQLPPYAYQLSGIACLGSDHSYTLRSCCDNPCRAYFRKVCILSAYLCCSRVSPTFPLATPACGRHALLVI